MDNVSERPREYFAMNSDAVLDAYDAVAKIGCRIEAVFHSHPAGPAVWSERDIRYWVPNIANILVAREDGLWKFLVEEARSLTN